MATAATSTTPRKTCVLSDVCILCGFSFVQIEKTVDGEEKIHKFHQIKLKLNSERLENIRKKDKERGADRGSDFNQIVTL